MEIDVKGWMETEGRVRYVGKGVLSNGKKYNYRFFVKDKPTHGRIKTTRQVFRNGKWRAE